MVASISLSTPSLSAFGPARATVNGNPLSPEELKNLHAFWRAANYLAAGMIYLRDNPLLREPLQPEHIKHRLLGHWGSSPGISFLYTHLNRVIKKFDQDMLYMVGPGHGAPGFLGPCYLEGSYSRFFAECSEDADGMQRFFKQFSFPGGIGSHCTPETPGSIHEGGELGYCLSHAYGAAFDNPNLIVVGLAGDGESETGPLATSWHSNKFINPIRDGAVLPVLHLNGYKINNPTILSRISHEELKALFEGYGYTPYFVEGSEPESMHQAMAATLDHCISEIHQIQAEARSTGVATRPRWPMIVMRTPKGWTGPDYVDNHKVEGFWRAHQVPMGGMHENPEHRHQLEHWMRSYKPEELFDENGTLKPEIKAMAPSGDKRLGSTPYANGGLLRRGLKMPDFRRYGIEVEKPGIIEAPNTTPLGIFLRDVMRDNMTNFRVFGPDENSSNKLHAVYEVSKKFWIAEYFEEDHDGGELSPDGRVMEMLSEHTLEGWLEAYLLTGRHGFFATYESFAHVITSMVNQHAKWLDICRHLNWRADISSLNILMTSTVWRQDHNGFTHQDPGFLDVILNKSPDVVRIYLPPDVNSLLSVADHCLQSKNYINIIVCDKQLHLQYQDMTAAIRNCTKGVDIWEWASNDAGVEPDVVIASAGDIPTKEALAATAMLREYFPDLKIRFVNVIDLMKLQSESEHPHGLSDRDFDSLFTVDKPIIFNFHAYPWLIHRLTYRRTNHKNLHVRGYKEKGNINTPMDLAIQNQIDRFSIAIDVIDRLPQLRVAGAHIKEQLKDAQIDCTNYAYEHGIDKPEVMNWRWPF
ncbi:phosphoketolase family protein [Synechocystis sp. LKSZ1]|uniref:phosphoketolase family protein n=1 Tax=Synechocystis sp. LKSZ1 TaxID=3144951 RepID=UPI00336BF713